MRDTCIPLAADRLSRDRSESTPLHAPIPPVVTTSGDMVVPS
jgi:hypothetical protein